ncbi:MAG: alpha/beta hydrolase, partial [Actinobacteria bacterium]|nr:alpha/beta hydrolase [Actinomycetota bacterium]
MRALSRWFLAVALGVTAGAMSSGGAQAGVETPHVSQGTSISWRTCGERLECARVPVPLDWDRPRGRTISLAVIRHLASRPDERIGSLFVNPGGPGQSGVGLVKGSGNDLDAWGDGRFDIVSWDPRGTNDSTPVRCFRTQRAAAAFFKGVTVPT